MPEIIIGDDTYIEPAWMDGTMARGYIPRDMTAFPVGAYAPPTQIVPFPRKEWPERIRMMTADKSRLSDIWMRGNAGQRIPALNQNDPNRPRRWGYCWFYATTAGIMARRAAMNQPYVRLSAFGGAYTIKGGRDEGAWGALSLDFAMKRGIPSEDVWPNFHVRQIPQEGDPVWIDAAKYKATDAFAEISDPVYDRDLSFDQEATMLLNCCPVIKDEMWWGHCIMGCDLVDQNPNMDAENPDRYAIRILNSWGDSWGEVGFGLLTGKKKYSDNAVAITGVFAS